MTMTTIFDNNNVTSSSPGRYVLEEEEVSEAPPPPLPDVVYNGTGYYIDGETEGFYDWETIFLSCIITLLPLLVSLAAALAVRMAWIKYKRRTLSPEDDFLREESSESQIPRPLHSHLFNSETRKNEETQVTINTDEPTGTTEVTPVSNGPQTITTRSNHSNTNGSIITMTLKNNHLIVEKEERSDLEEDSRETTMKYSPSARDGVFVVEVQQGVRRSPGSQERTSCVEEQQLQDNSLSLSSDQCALVHNPPERYSDEETLEECDENDYMESSASEQHSSPKRPIRTGLTQSQQSLSGCISYGYTNQSDYEGGPRGYSETMAHRKSPTIPTADFTTNTKPKITSALYKKTIDIDDQLLSDIFASKVEERDKTVNGILSNGFDDTA